MILFIIFLSIVAAVVAGFLMHRFSMKKIEEQEWETISSEEIIENARVIASSNKEKINKFKTKKLKSVSTISDVYKSLPIENSNDSYIRIAETISSAKKKEENKHPEAFLSQRNTPYTYETATGPSISDVITVGEVFSVGETVSTEPESLTKDYSDMNKSIAEESYTSNSVDWSGDSGSFGGGGSSSSWEDNSSSNSSSSWESSSSSSDSYSSSDSSYDSSSSSDSGSSSDW